MTKKEAVNQLIADFGNRLTAEGFHSFEEVEADDYEEAEIFKALKLKFVNGTVTSSK